MTPKNDNNDNNAKNDNSDNSDKNHNNDNMAWARASAPAPISDYLLERFVAGDLPAARSEALQRRLETDANGRERLEGLVAANAEILRTYQPAVVAEEIRRRLVTATAGKAGPSSVPGTRWRWSLGVPMTLVAAAALVLVVRGTGRDGAWRPNPGVASSGDPMRDRLKGLRPGLRVYRKAPGRIERLQDGAATRAGDELQLAYVAAGHKFGAVVSADGAGQVTFHLPAVAGPAVRLRTDGETALPSAYELDAAPGFERFVLVVSDEPFDASSLAEVAREQGVLPAGKVAVFFTVRKP